jgi:hypothetical protein
MQQELTRLLPQALQEAKAEPEPILVEQHHRIARDESNKIYLSDWLPSHAGDPAFKVRAHSSTSFASGLTPVRIFCHV